MRTSITTSRTTTGIACVLMLLLAACQQVPESTKLDPTTTAALVGEPVVDPSIHVETEDEIFYLPTAELDALHTKIAPYSAPFDRSQALLTFIFKRNEIGLEYINGETLTAYQTLQRGQANCLSLTILAYALANSEGFSTEFRDVQIPEYWVTRRGNSFLNGHVNLYIQALYPPEVATLVFRTGASFLVDFERTMGANRLPHRTIHRADIIAMFYNNKAAEALEANEQTKALAYLQAAIAVQPELSDTWNNLAVLHKRMGKYPLAERAYLQSLQLEPNRSNTMANLAILYEETGRPELAAPLNAQVERIRQSNPYYFLMIGNEASAKGQFDAARSAYQHSLMLNDRIAETHFAFAKILVRQGKFDAAAQHLTKARQLSGPGAERDLYQHKLDVLHAVANVD